LDVQYLTIIQQHDPYNPDVIRYAVCGKVKGRRGLVVLSNTGTLDLASEWIKIYRQWDDDESELDVFEPCGVTKSGCVPLWVETEHLLV
jgi:hypothetical protein